MSIPSLHPCLAYADQVERSVLDLGPAPGPLGSLPARCAAFRAACLRIASHREVSRATLAVVGPRNAGKSTLASLLVRNPDVRQRLTIGFSAPQSTRRIHWIGPERPADLQDALETWIECPSDALVDAGAPFQIADVPGFNDRSPEIRAAADRALESALIQILVVDHRQLEAAEVRRYIAQADGTILLPVVNRASHPSPSDLSAFHQDLRASMPRGEILQPIVIPDFHLRHHDESATLDLATQQLVDALRPLLQRDVAQDSLAAPQLASRLARFHLDVLHLAQTSLPATAAAVASLDSAERLLPRDVLQDVVGSRRTLRVLLRQRFRAQWLEHTPSLLFPWRTSLALAHLAWGALDRLPLALLGSLPSLASVAWTALRNARQAADFQASLSHGLHQRVRSQAADRLAPLVRSLHESLDADLGRPFHLAPSQPTHLGTPNHESETDVEGIDALQQHSAIAIDDAIDRHGPGFPLALLSGLVGTALFWSVAAWPLAALYLDYFQAALGTWNQIPDALQRFPTPAVTQILTTLLLGILPMGLWLLVVAAWVSRPSRIASCDRDLRLEHERIIQSLLDSGLLRVHLRHRALAACRTLLSPSPHPPSSTDPCPRPDSTSRLSRIHAVR